MPEPTTTPDPAATARALAAAAHDLSRDAIERRALALEVRGLNDAADALRALQAENARLWAAIRWRDGEAVRLMAEKHERTLESERLRAERDAIRRLIDSHGEPGDPGAFSIDPVEDDATGWVGWEASVRDGRRYVRADTPWAALRRAAGLPDAGSGVPHAL